jgi:hypothetical protein
MKPQCPTCKKLRAELVNWQSEVRYLEGVKSQLGGEIARLKEQLAKADFQILEYKITLERLANLGGRNSDGNRIAQEALAKADVQVMKNGGGLKELPTIEDMIPEPSPVGDEVVGIIWDWINKNDMHEVGEPKDLAQAIRSHLKRKIEAIDSKWLPIDKKEMILKALGIIHD